METELETIFDIGETNKTNEEQTKENDVITKIEESSDKEAQEEIEKLKKSIKNIKIGQGALILSSFSLLTLSIISLETAVKTGNDSLLSEIATIWTAYLSGAGMTGAIGLISLKSKKQNELITVFEKNPEILIEVASKKPRRLGTK